ncbi:MAG: hypothetical protein ABW185_28875 [Sedimenticola sp.]
MSTNILAILQRREKTACDDTKLWFVKKQLTYMLRHEWLFDSEELVQLHSLLLRLVSTYIYVLRKAYDIMSRWAADEEEMTSLVILAKIMRDDVSVPERGMLEVICEDIVMFSN